MATVQLPNTWSTVVGFPNWTTKVTWSGGSYNASYPVTNLGVLPLTQIAQTTNLTAGSCIAIGTLDRLRGIRCVSFHGDNMTLQANIRLRIYFDVARTTRLYDSGWVPRWPAVYPFAGNPGAPDWYDANFWDSKYTTEQLADTIWPYAFWLSQAYYGQAFTLEYDDSTNAAGFINNGFVTVSAGTQVSINPDFGAALPFDWKTIFQQGLGGVKQFDRRNKPRQFIGQITSLPRDESMALHFERLRQADLDTPFLWLPWPDDKTKMLQECWLARNISQGSAAANLLESSNDRQTVPLNLEEVL